MWIAAAVKILLSLTKVIMPSSFQKSNLISKVPPEDCLKVDIQFSKTLIVFSMILAVQS